MFALVIGQMADHVINWVAMHFNEISWELPAIQYCALYTVNRQIFGPFVFSSIDLEAKIKKTKNLWWRKNCLVENFTTWSRCQDNMMFIRVYTTLSEPCGWSSRPKRLTVWDTKTSRNCWNKPTGMSHPSLVPRTRLEPSNKEKSVGRGKDGTIASSFLSPAGILSSHRALLSIYPCRCDRLSSTNARKLTSTFWHYTTCTMKKIQ